MQRSGQAMVIVVDEFGGTAGLVTLQDLAAEIIGESHEPENLAEEPPIQILDEQTFLVQAQVDLEEVNDSLNLNLPLAEDYQTLGGFIIYQMQKIPAVGEQLLYNRYEMTVESAEGPRLERIQIRVLEAIEETETPLNPEDMSAPPHYNNSDIPPEGSQFGE
jgi:CBS domain containing-hemolysin-like protein